MMRVKSSQVWVVYLYLEGLNCQCNTWDEKGGGAPSEYGFASHPLSPQRVGVRLCLPFSRLDTIPDTMTPCRHTATQPIVLSRPAVENITTSHAATRFANLAHYHTTHCRHLQPHLCLRRDAFAWHLFRTQRYPLVPVLNRGCVLSSQFARKEWRRNQSVNF